MYFIEVLDRMRCQYERDCIIGYYRLWEKSKFKRVRSRLYRGQIEPGLWE